MQEFESLKELRDHLEQAKTALTGCAFQQLDLRGFTRELLSTSLEGSVFLGCQLEPEAEQHVLRSGGLIFPDIPRLPFKPYRAGLYSVDELYEGYAAGGPPDRYERTLDHRIYQYFDVRRKAASGTNLLDTLAQRLHDQSVTDALNEFRDGRRIVAIMGGHKMARDTEGYWNVVRMASELTRGGFLVASGGGPGAMEAANLGAWLSTFSEAQQREAVNLLARVKTYEQKVAWLDTAFEVRERFPLNPTAVEQSRSLSIPTWHYGHEPPNAFATDIAKYFENSVREEGLLAIANYGVIFTAGSAGTIQEIFQDACQNHYADPGGASPMVFFDNAESSYWTKDKPVLAVLDKLGQELLKDGKTREYVQWLKHTNKVDEAVRHIEQFAASRGGSKQHVA
jgi:predicted Rossmann-fold nucleotide-binding protein